jgi:branched-chain amino acid transport system ATP-binding protein
MLAVARALMSSPKLLLLDEPSLGLAPKMVDQLFDIVRTINREENVTVFLVEQNANEALLHADRAYVLESGRVTREGPAGELRRDERVIKAYLGG